jgi:putative ATP-dependent endonuclease of OLD family
MGKSTILSAIELLLDPRPTPAASEYEYHRRRVEQGFQITAVIGDLDDEVVSAMRNPPLQGWLDGVVRPLPDEDGAEAVLVARVIGSPELEVSHVLLTPGETDEVPFTVANRRRLLLSRVASGARASTEFRLGRGTLLDRHASGTALRAALRAAVADASAGLQLPEEAGEALGRLRTLFGEAGLPDDLHLSIITPQGWSLLALVGLLEGARAEEAVPLALAGAGTRQLALFRLAAALMEESPVVLLDEPEFGLEPYRQRRLVAEIRHTIGDHGQAFLSTHSPAVLEALKIEEISRIAVGSDPLALGGRHMERVQKQAPDALLSRLPVLCEGVTEAGLLGPVLNRFASDAGLADIDGLGIRLIGRSGQPTVLDEADELLRAGLACGLFVDNETEHAGRRAALAAQARCAFGSWKGVRNIEEALATWLPWDQLQRVLELAAGLRGRPVDDLLRQVGESIGKPGTDTLDGLREAFGEEKVREAVATAMQSRGNAWFKTVEGGEALGELLLELGIPPEIDGTLRDFWDRVRQEAGWV